MHKKKQKKQQQDPNFYDFVVAVANDQRLASQMLQEKAEWLHATNSIGETALHYLAIENDMAGVKFLIEKGAKIDSRSHSQSTPLMDAAQVGNVDICLLLMEKGADVNAKDDLDYTPLHYAAQAGKAELLDAMLQAGGRADANAEYEPSVAEVVLPRKRALLLDVLKKHGYALDT